MFKLYKYNMKYTFKKISTWILMAVTAAIIVATILPSFSISGVPGSHVELVLYKTGFFSSVLVGILLINVSYIANKTSNLFKDGEKDGTTLLITSKPFTRREVVFAKLIAAATHVVLITLVNLIVIMILALLDRNAVAVGLRAAGSFAIGSLVVNFIFLAICLLFAAVFGKVGTIMFTTFFAVLIVILSPIFQSVGEVDKPQSQWDDREVVYAPQDGTKFVANNFYFRKQDQKLVQPGAAAVRYRTLAWLDIWFQISASYNAFESVQSVYDVTSNKNSSAQIAAARAKYLSPFQASGHSQNTYGIVKVMAQNDLKQLYGPNFVDNKVATFQKQLTTLKAPEKFKVEPISFQNLLSLYWYLNLRDTVVDLSQLTLERQTKFAAYYVLKENSKEIDYFEQWVNDKTSYNYSPYDYGVKTATISKADLASNQRVFNTNFNVFYALKAAALSQYVKLATINSSSSKQLALKVFKTDDTQTANQIFTYSIMKREFITVGVRTTIWVIICLSLLAGATWIYFRRDFK